ncbi:division/cell wall cluster transcriptional repressor MraZ [Roseococcus sp. YIM B11640]|uniref:division/cell wall cluster transcriptional repressor MraZ n=1 Tax=Roseococcus sp. YIM B11640 TaxID=3133973 RepID=UPI003C7B1657
MTQFRGKFTNGLDKKGRCSVPAQFRTRLAGESLVLRRSTRHPCIEAWPASAFDAELASRSPLDEPDEDEEFKAYALFSDTVEVTPDPDGRMILPADLIAFAGLSDSISFLGRMERIELWEPAAAEAMIEKARQALADKARARASTAGGG